MRSGFGWSAAGAVAVLLVGGVAVAEPLPKEECEKLKIEHAGLVGGGIRDVLAKGPVWGRQNLARDRMQQVERYIALEELLGFRCGFARARLTLPVAEEDQPTDKPPTEVPKGAAAPEPPAPKPKPKPKPVAPKAAAVPDAVAKPEPATKPEAVAKDVQPAVAKPPPKPKPKAADAYQPAVPPAPGADPFAKPRPAKPE